MRLAYLVSQYPAINHAFMLREVKRLRQLGFEVGVASIRPPDRPEASLTAEERSERGRTFYVKMLPAFRAAAAHARVFCSRPARYAAALLYALRLGDGNPRRTVSAFFYFVEAVVVGHWMLREGFAHVHIHYSSTVGLIASRLFPITMSVTFHGPDEFNDPVGFRIKEKIEASLFACAISNYARSQLMKSCAYGQWSKLEVAPLGVETEVFAPRPRRVRPGPFELICAGRLAPVKGQHVLLEALEILARRGRNVLLRFAGDGPDRRSLEEDAAARGVRERVVFEGFVNQDGLRELYRRADAMALPSFAEGLPVVLMEAMAMEIPCVATWITGVPELIENGVNGLTVPPGDARALADAIERLVADPELCARLGRAARETVLERFDIARNGSRLAEVFQRRLAGEIAASPDGAPQQTGDSGRGACVGLPVSRA